MYYCLIKKKFGSSAISTITKFTLDYSIPNFIYVKNHGFFFPLPNQHCIGKISVKGDIELPWAGVIDNKGIHDGSGHIGLLDLPSSIYYYENTDQLYVVLRHGQSIVTINLKDHYIMKIFGLAIEAAIKPYFENVNNIESDITNIVVLNRNIYWMNNIFDRCFLFRNERFSIYVGSHRRGYSVSNRLDLCFFNNPCGMTSDGKDIFIADTGNHCIRKVTNNEVSLIAGNPNYAGHQDGSFLNSLLNCPKKICYKDGIIYCIDDNRIKYIALKDNQVGTLYQSPNIVCIDVDENRDLIIMEKYEN